MSNQLIYNIIILSDYSCEIASLIPEAQNPHAIKKMFKLTI